MARLPEVRVSYANDSAYMGRLILAVEMDVTAEPKWRTKLITLLQEAQLLMSEENSRRYKAGRI